MQRVLVFTVQPEHPVCSRQLLVGSSRVARVFRVLKQTRSRVTRVQHAHRVTCKYSQA